jgi:hypothetical protein
VRAVLNGKALPDQPLNAWASWVVFRRERPVEVGEQRRGARLPWGELSYRIYLSPDAPRCYPDLGPGMDAQWVDYRDFIAWMREDCLRRSIEAIRREDPDKFIKIYAPGAITDVMKGLAEDYGCYFPRYRRPGGKLGRPAASSHAQLRHADECRARRRASYPARTQNVHRTHGSPRDVNMIDYFPDIGQILWIPDQKAWFEARQPLIHLVGKVHYPDAEVAVLEGARAQRLTGFPFDHFDLPLLWNARRRHGTRHDSRPQPARPHQ